MSWDKESFCKKNDGRYYENGASSYIMKLLIIGPRWVGEWTEGMGRAANALGHTATLFFYRSDDMGNLKGMAYRRLPRTFHTALRFAENQLKRIRDISMNRRLVIAARVFQPDVIIILKGETISWDCLVALREMNVPLISWWVDDPFCFPGLVRHFDIFDLVFMFDYQCIVNLATHGVKHVMYLPCACDQATYYPQSINQSDYPSFNCTVGFIAMYYPGRATLLSQMKGLDVGLWGGGWEVAKELHELPSGTWRGQRISAADTAKVYNLARICPNVHHPQTRLGGLNTRTFEIPAAGGFELVDNVPGLEDHFDVGREIVSYSSPGNFRELVDYYLAHQYEREKISERGHARVMRHHTYVRRLETILKTLAQGGKVNV